ncbi:hypothetical protein [Chromobacterium sp. ASV23]|uniref:hypothetical protein n=1 Tax=Chromobacterium sp. ASV23 TaxID=2795110 RepID=UPI0018ECE0C7|nr:hypothetical protein [Chromobacterium sp. ASV23]
MHESGIALGSDEEGPDAVREILRRAADFLKERGGLMVEISHDREMVEECSPPYPSCG